MNNKKMAFNGNEIVFTEENDKGVAGISSDQPDDLAKELVNRWNAYCNLKHEYDSTRGLYCIDRNPEEVSLDWIINNSFQLKV